MALEGIRSLIGTKSYAMTIRWEDQELKGRFLLGMVTNANSVAGMKGLWGEHIGLSDGVFEVTLIEEPQTLAEWPELPMKSWRKAARIIWYTASRLRRSALNVKK